jgi:hypothetical protein
LITEMAKTTVLMCGAQSVQHPSCKRLLVGPHPLAGCVLPAEGFRCEPHYWVRAYIEDDLLPKNCPSSPPQEWGWKGLIELALPGASSIIEGAKLLAERTIGVEFNSILQMPGPQSSSSASSPEAHAGTDVVSAAASGVATAGTPASTGVPVVLDSASSAASAASSAPPIAGQPVCVDQTIYIQIFGPNMREFARENSDLWRKLGANVPPIEDVWDTARRANRPAPRAPATLSVYYSDISSLACAKSLFPTDGAWDPKPLPPSLTQTPGVIEVWLVPFKRECYQEDSGAAAMPRFGVHCFADRAQCNLVRGPNPNRLQTACQTTDMRGQENLLRLRGFGSSWYALGEAPFGAPFPALTDHQAVESGAKKQN